MQPSLMLDYALRGFEGLCSRGCKTALGLHWGVFKFLQEFMRVPDLGVLIIRIILFRVLY